MSHAWNTVKVWKYCWNRLNREEGLASSRRMDRQVGWPKPSVGWKDKKPILMARGQLGTGSFCSGLWLWSGLDPLQGALRTMRSGHRTSLAGHGQPCCQPHDINTMQLLIPLIGAHFCLLPVLVSEILSKSIHFWWSTSFGKFIPCSSFKWCTVHPRIAKCMTNRCSWPCQ